MDILLNFAQKVVDGVADRWTVSPPSREKLSQVKIVGHRGAGHGHAENQVAGFAACADAGVWGVEMDVRWTRDQVPIVLHDPDTRRVFSGEVCEPAKLQWRELRARQPQVASLQEVLSALAGRCHLMIEIKETLTAEREKILLHMLGSRRPKEHYHLLSLQACLLENLTHFQADCCILVSQMNARAASRHVLTHGWGGTAGHYLFQTPTLVAAHHAAGQAVGAGFITSFNNVCRQLHRQIDWVFTEHAVNLQQAVRRYLDQA